MSHDTEQTLAKIRQLIVDQLDVQLSAHELGADTKLFDGGLKLDSFAIVELITMLEDAFDFEFRQEDLAPESFVDLATLTATVTRNLAAAN